ncbi:MAG: dihydroxyacetone kinase subunit L [Anaerolineales bacterium]|nr:dihydroxyacetone kinase subunit L [Anaerolineales bacterium]
MVISHQDTLTWLIACAKTLEENREYLIELDAAIGDADHGANMDRGFKAVLQKLSNSNDQDIGAIFKTVGMTLVSTVGGAAGPLYGTFFLQAGIKLAGQPEMTLPDWVAALEAGIDGVQMRGKAQTGDKTMLDALLPAMEALKQKSLDGASLEDALTACTEAARQGMEATIPLVARKGRASYLGERSAGHQDPGATSSFLILKAASDCWK